MSPKDITGIAAEPTAMAPTEETFDVSHTGEDYEALPTYPTRPDFTTFENALCPSSQMVVFDGCPNDPNHPSSTPIYQTATFVQPNVNEFGSCKFHQFRPARPHA